jgi:hypothetical protein
MRSAIYEPGGREFHGSAYDFYRNEELNATTSLPSRSGTAGSPTGIGFAATPSEGLSYIPHRFNADRRKLFFVLGAGPHRSRGLLGRLLGEIRAGAASPLRLE